MIDISITAYRGFSAVAGETNLSTLLSNIRGGTYFPAVHKVEEQLRLGDLAKANAIKKQLPFFTLTGNYHTVRQSHSLIRYNPVITIDVDDLEDGRIEGVRQALASDPDVLAFFLTPKRHGFKIFLYLRTEYARRLRQTAFSVPVITYSELEKHHSLMYEAARLHIEQVTGVEVDVSGKDIGRGFFASFDVQAYFNTELLGEIEEIGTKVVSEKEVSEKPFNPTLPLETSPWHALEYKKALSTTRRSEKFREGNRDNFLFVLGNRCFRKDIPEEVAIAFAVRDFQQDDLDVASAIRNAYRYVSKTQAAVKAKEEKVPVVSRIMDFLSCRYRFRRNVILDRLEFAEITQGGDTEVAAERPSPLFRPLRAKDLNSIYVNLLTDGVNCSLNTLKAIVDSDYASCFNPFEDYLLNLPAWDGTRDYIGELADTVLTEDREFWRESFRRWLVGSVACALREKKVNQLVLILFGGQGKGKSTWISRLLPPLWNEYYHTGMINPDNKDDMLLLSTRYLINMEEFQGVKAGDLAGLKRIITQDSIIQRKVYDTQAFCFIRHASFIASTNKRRCLQDIDGNRRFLPSSVLSVDYRKPVDYCGVYSQAMALLDSGYRYWYEGDEIDGLNLHNELHRLKDPVEENLFVFFRRALAGDTNVKWMPASAILTHLTIFGKVQVNRQTQQELVQALEKYGFATRVNAQGGTEYEVVEFQAEEVERRFKE
ncbi:MULTISPECIES: VapE domain-containing protein [Bacteroides]|uniref:VapE domain-containing protein n=1 Tax=Bacteroides TaxID=816 RepID=UPI000E42FB2E|nr:MULTISPECIES: VapE domain-containing protein [Bacteroides]RGM48300.1 virulence protein E [Bacteroides sp. OM08-11]